MENTSNLMNPVTDLSFLKIYSSGNPSLMRQFIETFLSKTPSAIQELESKLSEGDFHSVSRVAHSLKPQFSYVGIAAATPLIIAIEEEAKDKKDPVVIEAKLREIKELMDRAYAELKETLTKL